MQLCWNHQSQSCLTSFLPSNSAEEEPDRLDHFVSMCLFLQQKKLQMFVILSEETKIFSLIFRCPQSLIKLETSGFTWRRFSWFMALKLWKWADWSVCLRSFELLPCFDVLLCRLQHLTTFLLDRKDGMITVDDGVRRLRLLDAKGKVWTQEMLLQVEEKSVSLIDQETKVRNWQHLLDLDLLELLSVNSGTVYLPDNEPKHGNVKTSAPQWLEISFISFWKCSVNSSDHSLWLEL